jgi:hypothetical protein
MAATMPRLRERRSPCGHDTTATSLEVEHWAARGHQVAQRAGAKLTC